MKHFFLYASALLLTITLLTNCKQSGNTSKPGAKQSAKADSAKGETEDTLSVVKSSYPPLDKKLYDSLLKFNAHGDTTGRWPVKNTPYPLNGAILPFKRVVAFYGNLYSKKMGILGELPPN